MRIDYYVLPALGSKLINFVKQLSMCLGCDEEIGVVGGPLIRARALVSYAGMFYHQLNPFGY
jgi:hypothetical protein